MDWNEDGRYGVYHNFVWPYKLGNPLDCWWGITVIPIHHLTGLDGSSDRHLTLFSLFIFLSFSLTLGLSPSTTTGSHGVSLFFPVRPSTHRAGCTTSLRCTVAPVIPVMVSNLVRGLGTQSQLHARCSRFAAAGRNRRWAEIRLHDERPIQLFNSYPLLIYHVHLLAVVIVTMLASRMS